MSIGQNIYELRKSRDITQENLATAMGVTAQAVSKWEGGGTPDIELLPKIADYFGVSIDTLFGRNINDYGNLETEISKAIAGVPREHRFQKAFDYCWAIEKGLSGTSDDDTTIDEIIEKSPMSHSQMLFPEGITLQAFSKSLKYFLIMPEPPSGWKRDLGYKDEYASLFSFFGNTNVLKMLYFLYERDNKPFTPKLMEKVLGIPENEATQLLESFLSREFIKASTIELDDEIKTVYTFYPNPAFLGLLAMSQELINKPTGFYYYVGSRSKPYFA